MKSRSLGLAGWIVAVWGLGMFAWVGSGCPAFLISRAYAQATGVPEVLVELVPMVPGQIEVTPEGTQINISGVDIQDETDHRDIIVEGRLHKPVVGQRIYFRVNDPDDDLTDDPVVDPNGSEGNDNRGVMYLHAVSAVTDARGTARVTLTVSQFLGDNFLIEATTQVSLVKHVIALSTWANDMPQAAERKIKNLMGVWARAIDRRLTKRTPSR